MDPRLLLERSGCARQSGEPFDLDLSVWESDGIGGPTCLCIVDSCNVVHAASDEVDSIWRPSQVIDLRAK